MASSKQRSSSLLPFELLEEILYGTPIESLGRFKSLCKEWYGLLNDNIFIYKHLDLSKERFMLVDLKKIQLFNPETKALVCLPLPDEFHRRMYSNTTHCDGLLLFRYGDTSRDLAVWNPILRRVKWIEPSNSYKRIDVCGLGYDNVSRDNYKILRMFQGTWGKFTEIEIYEFKSKLWRSVDTTLECNELLKSVSMNGNMYWIAQKRMFNSGMEIFIQSFDFCTETFKPICCVPIGTEFLRAGSDHTVVLSGFGTERLSLFHQHNHVKKIDLWVTNKVTDEIVSWSKCFNVTRPGLPRLHTRFHCSLRTKKPKLWCKDKQVEMRRRVIWYEGQTNKQVEMRRRVMWYEGQTNKQVEMRRRVIWYDYYGHDCHVYVPSLVPVPG